MYFLDIATWQYHLAYALYLEQKENTKNVHRQYEFMNDDIFKCPFLQRVLYMSLQQIG
uniref:Uncharacterized protein n=1 Tax=Anguilla anguilla TaxID=7936 RepID=A0A0E9SE23_ANGAN